jgi:hypothetical protein
MTTTSYEASETRAKLPAGPSLPRLVQSAAGLANRIIPSTAPGERALTRRVVVAPSRGARVRVQPRTD